MLHRIFFLLVSSFLEGRTGPQCMHRYLKSLDPEIKRGKWEKEEDDVSGRSSPVRTQTRGRPYDFPNYRNLE